MKKIVVLDPGIMEASGHHAALVSTLISYKDVVNKNVTLITHKQLAPLLEQQTELRGIKVVKHFTSNFYENYGKIFSLKNIIAQRYIRKLAMEYFAFFANIDRNSIESESTTYFYPCLNWDHAHALYLALSLIERRGIGIQDNQHKVCCMFTPPGGKNADNALAYKLAFSAFSQKKNVSLFASDFETREYYEALGVGIEGIHPCYLLPWGQINPKPVKENKSETPTLLLYLGDAKENKGFNSLPKLIKALLKEYHYKVTLKVQYTLTWDYPELQESIIDIERLSVSTPQVKLYKEYWDTKTLIDQLGSIDSIYCTYSLDTYKNKSSGVAWLAAFFNIPVVLYGECWLTREFDRLGHNYSYVGNRLNTKNLQTRHNISQEYFHSLYASLTCWLEE